MRLIRERAFYEKSIDVLHSNIAVMEDFLRIYKSTGAQHINELLGACYTLPQSSLLLRDDLEADDWPNFTFFDVFKLTANMLEHLGNWFHSNLRKRDEYRRDAIRKMDEYAKIGFFPGTNLFLTYGSSENKFDVQAIHRQIAMFASPPPSMETIEMLKRL